MVEGEQPTAIRPAFSAAWKQTAWPRSTAARSLAIRDRPALTGENKQTLKNTNTQIWDDSTCNTWLRPASVERDLCPHLRGQRPMENPTVAVKANVAFLRRDAAYSLELSWQLGYCRRNSQRINLRTYSGVWMMINTVSLSLFITGRMDAELRRRG